MTQEHPITPPDYLVKQWSSMNWQQGSQAAFADAARWGADQELEACVEWLKANGNPRWAVALQEGRRPKPLSLKEQSIALIDKIQDSKEAWDISDLNVVRRALESLPD